MATGDFHNINEATLTADSLELTLTGLTDPIPLEAVSVTDDATNPEKKVLSVRMVSPPILGPENGTSGALGRLSLKTVPGRVRDVHNAILNDAIEIWFQIIDIATSAISTEITVEYVSGWGTSGTTITDPNFLADTLNGPAAVRFTSTEQ